MATKKCWRCGNEMMTSGGKRVEIPFLISTELPPAVVTVDACSEYCGRMASAEVCKKVANVIGSYGEMVLRMDDLARDMKIVRMAAEPEQTGFWSRPLPKWVDLLAGLAMITALGLLVVVVI